MGMASALDQPDVSGYSRTIRQRYTDMIHKRLGQPFELPPGTKPPSHTQKPDKWSGDADVDKFNRWLHSLMRWLRINQYSVPAREEECITMIGLHLDGEAAVWFDEEVEDAEDDRQWTFLRVVIGLYDRFVQPTAIQDATEEFLATEYSSTTGVRGFLDALERTAKHMIHPPDAYMFRRQFVVGLPTTIRDRLVDRGYNAERHPISDLYSVALQAEESRVMAKHYTQAAAANRARNHPGSAVATSKVDKTSASTGGPRDSSRVHRSRQHPYASRRTGPNEPANAPSAPAGRSSTTGYGQHQRPSTTDTPQRQVTSGQFNASKAKCFACGNFGHISTDPRCPKYGQPRLNAARVDDGTDRDVNDDVEASADATDDRGEDAGGVPYDGEGLEGSQYSSSGDEPDNFDRYVDAVDEGVHMGTMDAGWSERLCSMVPAVEQRSTGKRGPAQLAAIRQRYQPSGHPIDRPKRAGATAKSIAQYVTINGIRAYTLFDSGCTTDCMSPDFARVAKVSYGYLKDVIPLQLGTVGSSASIQFGTYTRASFGSIDSREYFDVANIDRYDLILGTPWMHKHGVLLDFANRMIRVGDKAYPSLTEGEESVEMARRHAADIIDVDATDIIMSPNQLDLVEKAIQEQSFLDAQVSPPKSGKARQSRIAQDGNPGRPPDYLGHMDPDFKAVLTGVEIYTEEHIPHLRSRWLFRCKDIMGGSPNRLPPLRVINHTIPLYDEDKKYNYYLPRCPDSLKSHLSDKIAKYLQSGWWETCQTDQAAPMLCVLKKSGGLRTVVDCRKRNENTRPDVTPFPDQDTIRLDVARAKYRSKIQ
ncbi:hypothetical protein EYR36_010563 [Pleurotus pulmonarius]|nr:hypothetical protein EYR36_010563 [Pleurotus pulmonarius]